MNYSIIVLSVLALTACSETIKLSKPGGETIAKGVMEFRFNPPHWLTVTLNGKAYEGDVDSKEVDNRAELRERYGANKKHYSAILEGLNTTHRVHQYEGVLKAPDGATLTCEYLSSNAKTTGTCVDGKGQIYEVYR